MCGLFGFSGWDKANIAKLKLLGLYNKTRGRDSCGYFFNEKIVKGAYLKKEWDAFIEEDIIESKGKCNLFIGHTRAGTVGSNSLENAHPFDINGKAVIAHNGTLDNHWTMCNKYGIDHKNIHVDSLALGHLLAQEGYKILEEYKGYAAILYHNVAEPDTLYIYHGASRVYDTDEKLTEERPLFWMPTKEGIYISSLKNSLMAIRDTASDKPEIVPHNRVIKITKGKPAKGMTIIQRDNANIGLEKKTVYYTKPAQTYTAPSQVKPVHFNQNGNPRTTEEGGRTGISSVPNPAANAGMGSAILPSIADKLVGKNIWLETKPPRCFNPSFAEFDYMYYQKGRHYHIEDSALAEGILFLDKQGVVYQKKQDKVHPQYFYRGVMLKDEAAWSKVCAHIATNDQVGIALKNPSSWNFAQYISRYSRYPVTNLEEEGKAISESMRKSWWKEFKPASGSVQPLWADRNYVFEVGALKEVKSEDARDLVFTNEHVNEWANYKMFQAVNSDVKPIVPEGDLSDTEPVREHEITKEYPTLKTLIRYFDIPFTTIEGVMSECPTTVIEALGLYIKDLLSTNNYTPDEEDIIDNVYKFISVAIKDNVTLRENMDGSYPDPEKYVKDAYLIEIGDDYESSKSIAKALENLEQLELFQPSEHMIMERVDETPDDVKIPEQEYGSCELKKKTSPTQERKETEEVNSIPFTEYEIVEQDKKPTFGKEVYLRRKPSGAFYISERPAETGKVIEMKLSVENPVDKFIRESIEVNHEIEAVKQVKQLITYLRYLTNKTNRLKELDKSQFATDLAYRMADLTNTFKNEMSTVITEHNKTELDEDIKNLK